MFRILLPLVFTVIASAAPLCVSGASLASYIALGTTGCTVDPAIPLLVGNFSYSVLSSSNPGVVTSPTAIFVTPLFPGPGEYLIDFTSDGFSVSGADFVDYQIGFTWDPPVIRSADSILNDPVVPPGFAGIATTLCLGASFTGTTCSMPTASLSVSDDGITPITFASTSFAPVSVLGVLNTIHLTGGGSGGSASITGFANGIAPEPETWLLSAAGLLALALCRRSAS